jgi:deoxycytidine triphosphate deaminase
MGLHDPHRAHQPRVMIGIAHNDVDLRIGGRLEIVVNEAACHIERQRPAEHLPIRSTIMSKVGDAPDVVMNRPSIT